jgi:ABC-type dipeptide/oligopeptide/nickel transport system permease subunit
VLVLIVLIVIVGPWLSRYSPIAQDIPHRLAPPGRDHWLGTDALGRDTFARLVQGGRTSLLAGPFATLIGLLLGAPIGIYAGFAGRFIDASANRINDVIMSLPPLIIALATIAVLGPGIWKAMFAVGIALSPRFFRVMRATTKRVTHETYIEASRGVGCSTWRILRAHILPSVLDPLIVQASLTLGLAMLGEVALSFIGLGVQPPNASWGSMLADGYQQIRTTPFLIIVPGLAIFVTVLCLNYIGEGVRGALRPEDDHGI